MDKVIRSWGFLRAFERFLCSLPCALNLNGFLAYRMCEHEPSTIAVFGVEPDTSAKVLYYTARYRETETCSLLEGVNLLESLEHEVFLVGWYSAACICNADEYLIAFVRFFYCYGYSAALREFLRV